MYKEYKMHHSHDHKLKAGGGSMTGEMEFANPDWSRVALSSKEIQEMNSVEIDPTAEITVHDFIREKWEREQERLKKQMLLEDVGDWSRNHITPDNTEQFPFMTPLKYVGGVDISFVKGDNINACAAFVVLNFPELEVVHEDLSMVQLTAPYIPGFLAFREADFLVEKINKLKKNKPELVPQVILVDGNGILHPRGFGLACQLGVLTDLATVGVAKNLFCIDGIQRDEEHQRKIQAMSTAGDSFPIIGDSGTQHGVAYRSCNETTNPIFLSPGHKISMETTVWVTEKCIKYRVPEPTRQADILSREYLRTHWPTEDTSPHKIKLKKHEKRFKKSQKEQTPSQRPQGQPKMYEPAQSSDEDDFTIDGLNLWDS